MPIAASRKNFLQSREGIAMRDALIEMVDSPVYNTGSITDSDGSEFIDKHLGYVMKYPYIDPHQYMLNLKVKSRV